MLFTFYPTRGLALFSWDLHTILGAKDASFARRARLRERLVDHRVPKRQRDVVLDVPRNARRACIRRYT